MFRSTLGYGGWGYPRGYMAAGLGYPYGAIAPWGFPLYAGCCGYGYPYAFNGYYI